MDSIHLNSLFLLLAGAAAVMILSGAVPLTGSQKTYLEKVGFFCLTTSLLIGTLNITGRYLSSDFASLPFCYLEARSRLMWLRPFAKR
jgi:hypothetical protein